MQDSRLRACVLALPGVVEKPILDRLVFQVRGVAFATEGWPEPGWAVAKLSPADQKRLVARSIAIKPEPDRGAAGITLIRLSGVEDELLTDVLTAAWQRAYGDRAAEGVRPGADASVERRKMTPDESAKHP